MSDDPILPKSRTELDKQSFTRDANDKIARRVTDEVASGQMDDVIAQLEQINENTDGLELTAENINLNTDELEAKIDESNVILNDIRVNADELESINTVTNTLIESVITNTNNLESLETSINDRIGAQDDSAPGTDTDYSALNGRLQRVAQNITSSNDLLTEIRDNADTVETLLTNIGNNTDTVETNQLTQITSLELIDDAVHANNSAVNKTLLISAQLDDDNSSTPVSENNVGPLKMTNTRSLHVNLRNDAGSEVIGIRQSTLSVPVTPAENVKYVAATNNFTIAAAATDIARILGSASKTIRVKKVIVSGRTTSGSPVACVIKLIKYSTANTGGTSVATTVVPIDSNNAAGTATANHYTANPTLGTAVGNVATRSITFQSLGLIETLVFEFENPIVLRGVAEQLSINFNATSVTGSSVCVNFEWEEV